MRKWEVIQKYIQLCRKFSRFYKNVIETLAE